MATAFILVSGPHQRAAGYRLPAKLNRHILRLRRQTQVEFHFKSHDASAMRSRQILRREQIPDPGVSPSAKATEVNGCSLNSNSVTTPKLPPPPRRAQ